MLTFHSTTTLAALISRIDALKAAHRHQEWTALPDRYAQIRRELVAMRARNPYLSDQHQATIQASIMLLRTFEELVDLALQEGRPPENPAAMNREIGRRMDEVEVVLHEIERSAGGGSRA